MYRVRPRQVPRQSPGRQPHMWFAELVEAFDRVTYLEASSGHNHLPMGHTDRQSDLIMTEENCDEIKCHLRHRVSQHWKEMTPSPSLTRQLHRTNSSTQVESSVPIEAQSNKFLTLELLLIVSGLAAEMFKAYSGSPFNIEDSTVIREVLPLKHSSPSLMSPEFLAISLSSGIIAVYVVSCRWVCWRLLRCTNDMDDLSG